MNNFPDAELSTSSGMGIFSNLATWRVKDEASEDDKSSEVVPSISQVSVNICCIRFEKNLDQEGFDKQ